MADIIVPQAVVNDEVIPAIEGFTICPCCPSSVRNGRLCDHFNKNHNYLKRNTRRTIAEGYRTLDEINQGLGLLQQIYQCDNCLLFCKGNAGLNRHNLHRTRLECIDPREAIRIAANAQISINAIFSFSVHSDPALMTS